MIESYQALTPLMQVFWGCAVVASVVFVIQTIMAFVGMDSDTDFSGSGLDLDGDTLSAGGAMSMFTFRGFINLLMGFGWGGVCLRDVISNDIVLTLVALLVGVALVFVCALVMQKMLRLEHSGNVKPEDVVGCVASVYLRIPEGKAGKIQVSINGSVHEYDAIADEELPTGARVRVEELIESGTYRVAKI